MSMTSCRVRREAGCYPKPCLYIHRQRLSGGPRGLNVVGGGQGQAGREGCAGVVTPHNVVADQGRLDVGVVGQQLAGCSWSLQSGNCITFLQHFRWGLNHKCQGRARPELARAKS